MPKPNSLGFCRKHSKLRTCLYKRIHYVKVLQKRFLGKCDTMVFSTESTVKISLYSLIKLIVSTAKFKVVSFDRSPSRILSTDSKLHIIYIWLWIKQLAIAILSIFREVFIKIKTLFTIFLFFDNCRKSRVLNHREIFP